MAQRKVSKKVAQREAPTKRQGKLSLHPMQFEDALVALLNTPPPPKPAKNKSVTKKRTAQKRA
jgi:hypothetical protein